ncbi:MarR family transcriptional regulator [Vreelandella titanicae]|uniref:MarR family transcriptional regulator n=1 Tax=Vreelandella titanicae TaxID=664683 RepID=UPI0039BF0BE9
MQWASIIGLNQSAEYTLKDLFARLGLTDAQGRRAWDVLTSKKAKNQEPFVEIERLTSKRPGRPASRYRLSAKLVKALKAIPSTACEHHAEEIASLAKTTRLPVAANKIDLLFDGRSTGLTLSNRWLLMVLLAHADSPGIVSRLSVSALCRLTGMSRYRVTNQLKKLSDLGLIVHHQPGRYSPKAGTRKTSIYLFDLAHPLTSNEYREIVNVSLPPSKPNIKYPYTCLGDGIIDAAMTAGVCRIQIKALLKEYDAAEGDTSNDFKEEKTLENDSTSAAKAYDNTQGVMQSALALLPSTRYLEDGIDVLLHNYDKDDANWLLTSVHVDAARLLSTAWTELKEGQVGPDTPHLEIIAGIANRLGHLPEKVTKKDIGEEISTRSEESAHSFHDEMEVDEKEAPTEKPTNYHPLVILLYAMSLHFAKRLQSEILQTHAKPHNAADYEAMVFILTPVVPNTPDMQHLPVFQLRGYTPHSLNVDHIQNFTINLDPVSVDLKTYWRTHHQDCLSAITDEPDTPGPAGQ